MTILSVLEINDGRRSTIDDEYKRSYTRTYRVVTDDPYVGSGAVRFAVGLPRIWDSYITDTESDPLALCNGINVQVTDVPTIWTVNVEYSSVVTDQSLQAANPLDRPTEWSVESEKFQKAIEKDQDNLPTVNSANDAYDPPVEIDDSRMVLVMTRNELDFDFTRPQTYNNTLNQSAWFGFPAKTVRCDSVTGVRQFENDQIYWKVTYRFTIKPEGWELALLDQGFRDGNGNVFRDVATGQALSQPTLLNGRGGRLIPPITPTNPAAYNVYRPYANTDFSVLQLP